MKQLLRDLMVLTKFRINVVGVFTGYTAIAVYNSMHLDDPVPGWQTLLCMLALLLMGGAANTWNQIIEKERDGRMERTRNKRPLPSGRMSLRTAWILALVQLGGSIGIFAGVFQSPLAVGLTLFTVFYYTVLYTMVLKPRHYLNIVIGGVPGAMGPLLAWSAVADSIAWEPVALFAIIFLWTPPHFWALAIKLREDYKAAGIPMLPVVKGVDETTRQIFIYTVIMVIATLLMPVVLPVFIGSFIYIAAAAVFGAVFTWWAWRIWRERPILNTMPLFHFSILYIGLLFTGVICDALIGTSVPS
ncbi:MAG: heme o synthase [Planctomycetota bacterium]|jgi:protoheme IX farnesyltransferase|nr:heme o synthase [Planctomycetota bacterium]